MKTTRVEFFISEINYHSPRRPSHEFFSNKHYFNNGNSLLFSGNSYFTKTLQKHFIQKERTLMEIINFLMETVKIFLWKQVCLWSLHFTETVKIYEHS